MRRIPEGEPIWIPEIRFDLIGLHPVPALGDGEKRMFPKGAEINRRRAIRGRIDSPKPDIHLMGLVGSGSVLADKPVGGPGLRSLPASEPPGLPENPDYQGEGVPQGGLADAERGCTRDQIFQFRK